MNSCQIRSLRGLWGFRHYFVLFTFNSKLSFLFYHVNLPKGEVLVNLCVSTLINWGRVKHICVGNLTIIGSDNCLSPGRRQAIIWTDVGILLIGPSETDFNEILIKNHSFSFKKIYLKMSSGRWRPFCLGLHVLTLLRPSDAYLHRWFMSSFILGLSRLLKNVTG